jgi:16S rRNA (uracil1498-N3)-methyltransferase
MTRRRWIANEFTIARAALTGAHAAHLARTLRARVGQEFEVACGDQVRRATVSSVSDDRVEFTLGEEVAANDVVPITLLLAVFKFDRMEWAIEKCTELNVTRIVPVIARRTEKHLALAAEKRVDRWQRIAREASEQSRRTTPPEILPPMKLKEALGACTAEKSPLARLSASTSKTVIPTEGVSPSGGTCGSPGGPLDVLSDDDSGNKSGNKKDVSSRPRSEATSGGTCWPPAGALNIVLAETERTLTLTDILRSNTAPQSLTLAIGPEGGWTDDELQLFTSSHWIAASLGDTILRAETAAIAALAIARSFADG